MKRLALLTFTRLLVSLLAQLSGALALLRTLS